MAKKTTVPFLEPDELRAACAYMGASNLGFDGDKRLWQIIATTKDDYGMMGYRIEQYLGSMCESDEMFDGMLAECYCFKKDFNSKNPKDRAYWQGEWKKALDKAK